MERSLVRMIIRLLPSQIHDFHLLAITFSALTYMETFMIKNILILLQRKPLRGLGSKSAIYWDSLVLCKRGALET